MKLPLTAYDWALRHLITEGDTDLFPTPFEVGAIKYAWPDLRRQFKDLDITTYAWRGGRRFVVPKKMLAFRIATQLDPIDSLVLAAILYRYGKLLEKKRIPVAENRVFASRLALSSDGRLYSAKPSWHDFWRTGLEKAGTGSCTHVVVADITDFYNQIYHHVLERYLEATLPAPVAKVIKRFLQGLSDKVSRGIPVGPHASHIFGECALDATDRSLLSHGYDFCRYGDDMHIFCASDEAATGALYDLAQILDNQQRLTLQNEKTRILTASDFAALANSMLVDRPANTDEERIIAVVSKETGGDRYREVKPAALTPADQKLLTTEVLERLLSDYLGAAKIDYARLGWLLRRLAQIGAPGGLDLVLSRLAELSPVLGPAPAM